MALTITIEGKGVIANADASPDTAMAGSAWNELGGGTDSFTTDTYLYGTTSFAGAYSSKSGFQFYDIGSGNELDFSVSGTEEDQFIYMWINCPTLGLVDTIANKGLAIRLGTSQTDYREYIIAGSDDQNGWLGDWKCFVIDPTKSGSVTDTGTYLTSSVRYMGVWIDTTALAKGDNIFISQISVGSGLRITGTSTTSWKDMVDYCTDYPNRAWGMFTEKEGIYFAQGKTYVGDTTQSANVSFTDTDRVIQYAKSEYWSGSAWVTLVDLDYAGIVIEDHASYTTTFQDGILVGSDNGRSGSTIIGNSINNVSIDLYGGNNASSVTKLYGTSIKNCSGSITGGSDSDHHFYGGAITDSEQFNPNTISFKNNTISNYGGTTGSLLIDADGTSTMSSLSFNSAGTGHAIYITATGTYAFNNFSYGGYASSDGDTGNEVVYNNSSGAVTINVTGGDTPTIRNGAGATTTVNNNKSVDIHVQDAATDDIVGAVVAIYDSSDDSELSNSLTNASGDITTASISGGTDIYIRVRKSTTGTRYYPIETVATVSDNLALTITLVEDTTAT